MKISKRVVIAGLSALIVTTPCFAQTNVISLNSNEAQVGARGYSNRNYAPTAGYVSYKNSYLKWLDSIEIELENKYHDLYADTSTPNLIKIESQKCEVWDNALNEIYGVLKEKLSDSEMEKLRQAQRNWIVYRDSTAQLEQDNSGGSIGRVIYAATLCSLTKERCYYLVNNYMP